MRQFKSSKITGLTTILKNLNKIDDELEKLQNRRNKLAELVTQKIENEFGDTAERIEFNHETLEVRYHTGQDLDEIEAAAEKLTTKVISH